LSKDVDLVANGSGFGNTQPPEKPAKNPSKRSSAKGANQSKNVTKGTQKREAAAQQYDKLKSQGLPEFNIYIRIQGKPNWFPVGSLSVNRTSKINQAIFEHEADLRQGAFRLFPTLRKHQQNLEYGYRLKEFMDEAIQVAVPPKPSVGSVVKSTIAKVTKGLSSLLRKDN
jgi:hypothetical protein